MSQREQNITITILVILLPIVSFLAGYFVNDYVAFLSDNQQTPAVVNTAAAEESDLGLFWEAWGLIENNFIGQTPSDQQLSYAVIRGALSSLNDPYTIFLEPVVRQEEQISLRGNFGGIGAYIQRNDENQVILLPIPGNPAELAGILEGDVLLAIDGEPVTDEMTSEEIAEKVRGEKGTTVTLTVIHVGETEAVDIEVERGDILVPSVIARMMPDQPNLGYIQLSRFSGESAGEIETAVLSLQEEGAQSIILDLRGNGGGLLDAAVNIADQFVAEGVLLYQESVRDGERVYNAT
ncbi:MAG: PDZ domain-containing protein, partial [Anaerolineales bacterium]|nr:PDZ domain-containing protein [Anaerolineales bacterium]